MDDQGVEKLGGLRARLLGRVELVVGGRDIPSNAWPRRNSRYLLLLLLCSPGHRLSRDMAMESLWPNASLESATRALYVAIHGLRRVLEPEITTGRTSRFVDLSGDIVQLVPGSVEWLDVEAFEAALDAGGDRRENLTRALSLYAGDLLAEEPYLDWPAARREQLRWRWREAVLENAELERRAGRPMLAVPSVERILEGDPGDELAYRALMTAYAEADRLDDARRAFERCVASLESELGVEPSRETVALWEAIQEREVARPEVTPGARMGRMDSLPRPANPLVGRGREVEELLDLVCDRDIGLVTVSGTGGLGKTRTALEVASLAKDEFEHGVAYVPLGHIREASLVVPAVMQALGLVEVSDMTPLHQVQDRLREASMLVVLDNFEQVIDAAGDVAAILEACPDVTMLVTSRAPLRIMAEHEFSLEPLAVPNVDRPISLGRVERYPSVELFAQRAAAVRRSFSLTDANVEAVARVCARLDGVPLAIELAAARIRDLRPEELVDGLHDRFELLSGGYRDMPPRHQTMRAAIAWSYDLLKPDEQAVFRRLGVFDGGFGVDAAAHVAGADLDTEAGRTASILAALEEQGLLRLDNESAGRRFSMFETIREFSRDALEASGEFEDIARRHADWHVGFVNAAVDGLVGADQSTWFERVRDELANIRAAIAFTQQTDPGGDAALQLTASIWRYWWKVGKPEEGLGLIMQALHRSGNVCTVHRARALHGAGELSEALGRYDDAERMDTEALEIFRSLGNQVGEADVLDALGILRRNRGDLDRSEQLQRESLAIHRRLGNERGVASALNGLGAVAYYRGDADSADRCWSEAVEITRKIADDRSMISLLGNLSAAATMRKDFERALSISEEVVGHSRRIGDENGITYALTSLGTAQYELGDVETAARTLEEALARSREHGLVQVQAVVLFDLAKISLKRDDVPDAVRRYSESFEIFRATDNAHGIASCMEELGGIALDRGEDRAATRWLSVADALREAKGLSREPVDRDEVDYQTRLATIRERVGGERFEADWSKARGLAVDAVVSEVLTTVKEWSHG